MVWYFIGVNKINKTLNGCSEMRNSFSCLEEFFNFVSPSGHVISSIYYSFKILAPIPRLISHNPLVLTIFGSCKQYTINLYS